MNQGVLGQLGEFVALFTLARRPPSPDVGIIEALGIDNTARFDGLRVSVTVRRFSTHGWVCFVGGPTEGRLAYRIVRVAASTVASGVGEWMVAPLDIRANHEHFADADQAVQRVVALAQLAAHLAAQAAEQGSPPELHTLPQIA
jgi:hypothetical protein